MIDTVTGADGLFRASALPTGHYNVVVQRDGFMTEAERFDPTQKQRKLLLRLLRPASFLGASRCRTYSRGVSIPRFFISASRT
jgi:hypothetical protein